MSDEEDDPTKVYPWQQGTREEVRAAIEKRRQQLLACDLASNPEAQKEWMVLLQERNLFAVTALEESRQERQQEILDDHLPPLCGWLLKRNSKFPYAFRRRWFVYDENRGLLICYRDKSTNKKPLGYIDLGELDTIRIEDPTGRRFKLVTSSREWQLMAVDAETSTMWMDEIRGRQAHLKEKRSAAFTASSELPLEEEEDEGEDEDVTVVERDSGLLFKTSDQTTFEIIEHMEAASATSTSSAVGSETARPATTPEGDGAAREEEDRRANEERAKIFRELGLRQQALKAENSRLRETVQLLQRDLVTREQELTLKDQAIQQLQSQLQQEKEALAKQMRDGVTVEELSSRLAWSQTDLAHTRALLDLSNQRIAGAMEALAFYKAMLDGASVPTDTREAIWLSQLENAQQQLDASVERNEHLQQEIDDLKAQLGRQQEQQRWQ